MKKRFFPQETKYSCGLASIRNVLYFCHHLEYAEKELEKVARRYSTRNVEKDGFGPRDLAKTILFFGRKNGKKFKVTFSRRGNLGLLEQKLRRGIFPIIHLQTDWGGHEGGHYSFVYMVTREKVYLFDVNPRMRYQQLMKNKFNDLWKNKKLGNEKWVMLIEEQSS